MTEINAKGTKGFLLYSPFSNKYFFRVYGNDKKTFTDYDIRCEEIEIEILTDWNSFYIADKPENDCSLDWSSKARGRQKNDS